MSPEGIAKHFARDVPAEEASLPRVRMCMMKRGDVVFEIIGDGTRIGHQVAADPGEDYRIIGFRHVAFEVDDVDAVVAGLVADGVPVFFPPTTFDVIGVRAAPRLRS